MSEEDRRLKIRVKSIVLGDGGERRGQAFED
jgi:hypothetical protein